MSRDALVVGINLYSHFSPLNSPAGDAEAIAQYLETHTDFQVKRLPGVVDVEAGRPSVGKQTRVSVDALENALATLFNPDGNQAPDAALLFFSGHGHARTVSGMSEGFLAASDTDPRAGSRGVSLQWLRRLLLESPIRQQIVWLDCCHAGELLNFGDADPTDRGKGRDRCFIAGSRNYEASFEQMDGAHGELTGALLRALDPAEHPGGVVDNHSLVSHLLRNWKSGLQRPIVHNSGHQILFQQVPDDSKTETEATGVCPYKGLSYFDFNEEDPEYFFGRTALTDALLEKVRDSQSNFLAVLGPSGSGKSSVVRAGLLHQLRKGQRISGSEGWRIRICKPVTLDAQNPTETTGEDRRQEPLENLAMGLADPEFSGVDFAAEVRKIRELLKAGPEGLVDLVKAETRDGGRLVLFIDQFEEIFTLWRSNEKDKEKEAEYAETRKAYFHLLFGALGELGDRIQLILAMRADFLGKCTEEEYSGLPKLIQENLVTVTPMTAEELLEAVEAPARKAGLTVQRELADQMVADVKDAPGSLPLLQFALTELWKVRIGRELNFQAYRKLGAEASRLGGVKGLLAWRADAVYEKELNSEEKRAIAERIFKDLTQPGEGTEDTRRQVFKESLIRRTEEEPLVSEVLRKLADANLIVTSAVTEKGDGDSARAVVDVAHEALIRHWPKLREWIDENREDIRFYRRVEEAAARWKAEGKKEGLVWRSPDLERLIEYRDKNQSAMSEDTLDFFGACVASRRKKKIIKGILVAAAVAAAVVFAVLFQKTRLAEKEVQRTQLERTNSLYNSRLTHASLLVSDGVEDYARAKGVLEETRPLDGDVPADRRHARNLLGWYSGLMGGKAEQVYTGAEAALADVAVSPDGRFLAAGGEWGTLVVFDAESGEIVTRLKGHDPEAGNTGNVWSIAFHPEKSWLFSGADDATIRRWSTENWEEEEVWNAPDRVLAIALNPDGTLLASGGTDNAVTLWQTENGTRQGEPLTGHEELIASDGLAFSPDGRRLASASYDQTARIWDVESGEMVHKLEGHTDRVYKAVFSQDGRYIATGSKDQTIILWNANTGRSIRRLRGHRNMVFGLQFLTLPGEEREYLLSASFDRTLRLWDVDTGVTLRAWQGHKAGVGSLAMLPDDAAAAQADAPGAATSPTVFSASNDGTVRRWRMETPGLRRISLKTQQSDVLAWAENRSPEEQTVIREFLERVNGTLEELFQWAEELPADRLQLVLELAGFMETPEPASTAVSPDGKMAVVGFANGAIRVFDRASGAVLFENADESGRNWRRLAFAPNARFLAGGSYDGTAKIWQWTDGRLEERHTLEGHESAVHDVAFSPDGRTLATASYDGQIGIWDVETGEKKSLFPAADTGKIESVSFFPDGKTVLSGNYDDQTIRRFTLDGTPVPDPEFPKANDLILWAALGPHGRRVAAVGREQIVTVSDARTGEVEHRLPGHESTVFKAIFSLDGEQLASLGADATVRFWDLTNGEELFTLRLPAHRSPPVPAWDFDFKCTPTGCYLAVPLTHGELLIYDMGDIYGDMAETQAGAKGKAG